MTKNQGKLLEKFLLAIKKTFSLMDPRATWPALALQLEPYFAEDISLNLFKKFKKNPQRFKKALKRLRLFTLQASLYHTEITGLKAVKKFHLFPLKRKDILDFIFCFFDVIKEKTYGEIFSLDGTHKVLSKKEVSKIEKEIPFIRVSPEIQKNISFLVVALENFVWALFFDPFVCAGSERHGPYFLSDGSLLLVREYFNLNPKEIWKNYCKYHSCKLYLKYKKNTKIKIDYANHVYLEDSKNGLLSFSLFVDEKRISSLDEIKRLYFYFSSLGKIQAEKVNTLSPKEIIKKSVEIYYFRYKDFFKFYKESWHPPKEVYKKIDKIGLKFWNYFKKYQYQKPKVDYFLKLFDPRNDFIGEI